MAIENLTLPFSFKRLHTPKLVNWDGSNESAEFRKLVEDISAKIGTAAGKPSIAIDNRKPGTIFRDTLEDGTLGPEMVVIPAGTFQMGDIHGMGDDSAADPHSTYPKSFCLGSLPVTFDEYYCYTKRTGGELPGSGQWPAIYVSWNEAVEYTKWLSTETGKRYRLPTEAEWEYAARSGGKDEIRAGTSGPWGRTKPDGLGLYDMSGGVWQWVEDCWHQNYDNAPEDGSAWLQAGGGECGRRVVRGDSGGAPGDPSSLLRGGFNADSRSGGIGFRLARDLE